MSAPLAWRCAVCHKPIADGEGYLTINLPEVHAAEREDRKRRYEAEVAAELGTPTSLKALRSRMMNLSELSAYVDALPKWRPLHRSCDPGIESQDYFHGVKQLRTAEDMLAVSAHMGEYSWLHLTNWSEVLYAALRQLGRFADFEDC